MCEPHKISPVIARIGRALYPWLLLVGRIGIDQGQWPGLRVEQVLNLVCMGFGAQFLRQAVFLDTQL